jgi:hypothetical protein
MKNLLELAKYKMALIFALCMSTIAYAQEEATEVAVKTTNSTTTSTQWYTEPWVWVAGAVLFIILIAAIIGGRSNTTVERHTTTVHRDVHDA